jgi:DNA repair protein RecO
MEPVVSIVVGYVNVGDNARVVRLLTAHAGRVSVMARRGRGKKGQLGALLELGNQLIVRTRPSKGELATLLGADVHRAPLRGRETYDRIAFLSYACEVCSALAPENCAAPKHFRLLQAALAMLEGDAEPNPACRLALESKALTFSGLQPALVRCARCGGALEESAYFDHLAGGAVHEHCGTGPGISRDGLFQCEALRRTPIAEAPSVQLADSGLDWLLSDFVQHQLGSALKSRSLFTAFDSI